jgi:predicted 3-demethylubiquinone-9 3-methyltransferase (glyoxalase superfamily)
MGSSKVDREVLKAKLQAEFEATLNVVVDSIDNARDGAWIEDSEGLSRQALDRFRQQVYEAALQAKIDAAEAAFSPSEEHDGSSSEE